MNLFLEIRITARCHQIDQFISRLSVHQRKAAKTYTGRRIKIKIKIDQLDVIIFVWTLKY